MREKIITVMLAVLLTLTIDMGAGCGRGVEEPADIYGPGDVTSGGIEEGLREITMEMVPLAGSPAMFDVMMPTASGSDVRKNEKAEIDVSNTSDGYVMVRYLQNTNKQLRVIMKGPKTSYTYTLKPGGVYEVYPLSDGNGSYQISVYENISGNQYATAFTTTVSVKLRDEFAPFLRPNQYVNYNQNSETVRKAAELIKSSDNLTGKITAVYNYVINNITYDKQLAATVKSGYLPDVDAVLKKKKGICFDYAAVMTAMLRSQGIPTKLVVGYTGQIYHAWISVYSAETGWINNVIYFDGKSWKLMDPTFASSGGQSSEVQKYIGDGKNYTTKYLY